MLNRYYYVALNIYVFAYQIHVGIDVIILKGKMLQVIPSTTKAQKYHGRNSRMLYFQNANITPIRNMATRMWFVTKDTL